MEAELQREALLKRIGADKSWSNYEILEAAACEAGRILEKYLRQMQTGMGTHLRYSDAVEAIEHANLKSKTRERMLCLLRKASDSKSLTAAIQKTESEYKLNSKQSKALLKKFDRLNINPITLRNDSSYDGLLSLVGLK